MFAKREQIRIRSAGVKHLHVLLQTSTRRLFGIIEAAEEPLYVALSEEHPLAHCPALQLKDMDGCPWIVFTRNTQPLMRENILRVSSEQDIRPAHLQEVLVPEEAYPYIMERNSLAILTRSAALRIGRDGVTIRPLTEQRLRLKTYLSCRADNESKAVSELVRAFGRCEVPVIPHFR